MSAVVVVLAALSGGAVAQDHDALANAFGAMRAPLAAMAQLGAQSQAPSEEFRVFDATIALEFRQKVLPVVLKQGVLTREPNSSQVEYRFEGRWVDPQDGRAHLYHVRVTGNLAADGSFAMTSSTMMVEITEGKEGEAGWRVVTNYFDTDGAGAPVRMTSEIRERLSDGSLKVGPRKSRLPGPGRNIFLYSITEFERLFPR